MILTILNYAYAIIAVQSLIVFIEVYINFRRTGALKNVLLTVVSGAFFISTANLYCNYTVYNRWLVQFPVVVILAALIIFFSLLYQHKLKRFIIAFAVGMVLMQLSVFLYFSFVFPVDTSISILNISEIKVFRRILRYSFSIGMLIIIVDLFFKILKKYRSTNIYFREIKKWAAFLVVNLTLLLIASSFKSFFGQFEFIGQLSALIAIFFILLTFLFRPKFLNSSSLKISLGTYFNLSEKNQFSKQQFIDAFYHQFYYLNPEASLENLSKLLNVNADDLYRFIYKNYHLAFNDLINQNRVVYFIDLVKKKAYPNYTIDALAQKSGFSSRHHLYRPFKKFHGGNPSDFIRSIRD